MHLVQASCTEFTLPGANLNGAILCVAKRANFYTSTTFGKLGWAKTGFPVVTIKKVLQISNKSMNEFSLVL